MLVVVDIAVFLTGAFAVVATLGSAIRTVVLPRAVPARLGSVVFVSVRRLFDVRVGRAASYGRRDRMMAPYAPVALLTLAFTWLLITYFGYTAMFWAVGEGPLREDLTSSGSALLTLGFEVPDSMPAIVLAFSEALIGLTLLALLITYLPSLYAAFSARESEVALLDVRAGSPPSGVSLIERYALINWIGGLSSIWGRWERWFVDVEESHTSHPSLVFFRSPQPDQSWVTAAGAVLDAAALVSSTFEDHDPDARLCLQAGSIALRRIAGFFGIPVDTRPKFDDPISITRDEYDQAYDCLVAAGVAVKADRDQAWTDFAGWRVNYDQALLALASLTMAPYAPWSSDRSSRFRVRALPRKALLAPGPGRPRVPARTVPAPVARRIVRPRPPRGGLW